MFLSFLETLAPKSDTVARINYELMNKIPTVIKKYKSVDSVLDENEAVHYPTEFPSCLDPPGTPPHKPFLKVGVPILLLRKLDPPKLCNGTMTEATIITGCVAGEEVFIPRIPIKPTDMPFEIKRTQFPV
ncbi:uncharacterized protein LOC115213259 [Octopus sinensis]|uniref:Uncharacterized protein LOC115213259 n=1 Tax=Octopus sinensis TaxID=2607531 RepID=A0A6P7SI20_9MOLL|nr:uncharacterized protein LOC115213259 [Octopus sinensis]